YHTLKGASNSIGLVPVGQQLHVIESFVERLLGGGMLPDLRAVVSALASEHTAMRANIARASAHGALDADHEQTSARLAAIADRRGSWPAPSDPAWPRDSSEASHDSHASHASRDSHASHDSAASAAHDSHASRGDSSSALESGDESPAARRFVRVAADRLD